MENIRFIREANGMIQAELARRLHITRQSMGAIEKPGFYPAAKRLPDIAAALGCSIDDLFAEGTERSKVSYQNTEEI